MFNKKDIKKITKSIIVGSIILGGTFGVYAANTSIQTYISNFSSSDSEIGKLINGFFDTEGYIKTEFIKDNTLSGSKLRDNSIGETQIEDNFVAKNSLKLNGFESSKFQKRVSGICSPNKAIQKINSDGTVSCVGSGSLNGGASTTGGKFIDGTNPNDAVYMDGNVGIGTINPTQKLDVAGNIKTIGGNVYFGTGNQRIYGDNSSTFYVDSNNDNYTQMIFRDKQNTQYGRVYGNSNGANFGLLDGDGNWSYLAAKDNYTSFRINNSEKMRINSNGNVGIGTNNPTQKLEVAGNIKANSFIYTSDRRLKKDIHTLDNSLENISKMRGVRFKWKKDNKKEIGLIAQEVEKVYPDLVVTDDKGMKAVKYGNVVAILIEGVKELYNKVIGNSEEIEKIKVENTELKNKINTLEEKMDILEKKLDVLVK